MNNEKTPGVQDERRKKLVRWLLIGFGAALIVLVMGLGTVFLLRNFVPQKSTSVNLTAASPAEVVASYKVSGTIKGLSDDLYEQQTDDSADGSVQYKLEGRQYSVKTMTQKQASFYAKKALEKDDTKSIQDQTTSFMAEKGYTKVADSVVINVDSSVVTYESEGAVCQLQSSLAVSDASVAYHVLVCVEKSAIVKEYETIENLRTLRKEAAADISFTQAVRSYISEENKALSVVNFVSPDRTYILLFVAVDTKWTYVGQLNSPGAETTGKYTMTPELQAAIDDPAYGTFLAKYILGRA